MDSNNYLRRNVSNFPDDYNVYYLNYLAYLNFHPILNFNNTYDKFYRNVINNNQNNLIEDTPLNFNFKVDKNSKQVSIFNQRNQTSNQISPLKIKDILKNH